MTVLPERLKGDAAASTTVLVGPSLAGRATQSPIRAVDGSTVSTVISRLHGRSPVGCGGWDQNQVVEDGAIAKTAQEPNPQGLGFCFALFRHLHSSNQVTECVAASAPLWCAPGNYFQSQVRVCEGFQGGFSDA